MATIPIDPADVEFMRRAVQLNAQFWQARIGRAAAFKVHLARLMDALGDLGPGRPP